MLEAVALVMLESSLRATSSSPSALSDGVARMMDNIRLASDPRRDHCSALVALALRPK